MTQFSSFKSHIPFTKGSSGPTQSFQPSQQEQTLLWPQNR
jgi:hypothetical protein